MAIDPSRGTPKDAATVSSLQSTTEESAKQAMRAPVDEAWSKARRSLFGDLLGFIANGVADAIAGLVAPGTLWGRVSHEMQYFRDGQQDLADRADLLSPLLDYGSAYVNPNNRVHGAGWAVFSEQLGPMRGCEMIGGAEGGIRLLDKGLWDIRCQLTADGIVQISSNGPFRFELLVHTPGGTIFSRQAFTGNSIDPLTGTIVSSVVVPEPRYKVYAYVTRMSGARGILGGPAWSRLTVQHIDREIDGTWSKGNEESTPDPS